MTKETQSILVAAFQLLALILATIACTTANRYENEIVSFEIEDQKEGYQQNFILFTGSSSIRLWETLQSDMAGLKVLNRGFGGATLKELNQYWNRISGKHSPELVVLYCGENDIAEGATVQETVAQFDSIMAKYQTTYPLVPLLYIAMKPSPSRIPFWPDYQKADQVIHNRIKSIPNAEFVDLSSTMFENGKLRSEIFKEDSLHMNALGYDSWTAKLRPIMESKLPIPKKP